MTLGFFQLCRWSAILWLAVGTAGCLHAPAQANGKASLHVLGGSLFCGRSDPAALVIQADNGITYKQLLAAHNLQGLAAPDFKQEIAVLVALGQRPTLGYGLQPTAEHAPVQNGVAMIAVRVLEPPRNALVGQALTSPCLLLAVEREEVSTVQVQDQHGRILGQAQIN